MITKTYKFFNQSTKQALLDQVNGYVDKSKSTNAEITEIKRKYNLSDVYRFDLGENVDGFSPVIMEFLEDLYQEKSLFSKINEYPDITHRNLRKNLSDLYAIKRENIVLSTGLDSILDLITRVFFDQNDVYLMSVPDFFLFENYSERMGATPVFLPLNESDHYQWTKDIFWEFNDMIIKFKPKIVWISNPANPTGQYLNGRMLEEMIKLTCSHNVFLVIDEAYAEFIGGSDESAARYIKEYNNLMVLRTFSKGYGLAGIRLGYLMCSSKDIVKALLLHRHHFPVTQLALNLASIAIKDQDFLEQTRRKIAIRKENLFKQLNTLSSIQYIPSNTNIFMLKHKVLSDIELNLKLKQKGILTSLIKIPSIEKKDYLRITIRTDSDNEHLFSVLKQIENEDVNI
ncbi:pyridoxal phosphate-dependent aminotransferase [Bacteroidota bacterium]